MSHKSLSLRSSSLTRTGLVFSLVLLATIVSTISSQVPNDQSDPFGIAGFDCARIEELAIEKQLNMRAAAILKYCRDGQRAYSLPPATLVDVAYTRPSSLSALGGLDINLITGPEGFPNVTQAESSAWGHGNTVVVAMDDSREPTLPNFCSVSVSTDGGATFTRLSYNFADGGNCQGDPSVFYSRRAGKWFVGFFATRCGANQYGQWESTDGISWSNSGCYTVATASPDVLTTWVDNNPSSPFYGRQYAAYNNFSIGSGAIQVVYSTDDGVNFSAPVTVFGAFRRSVEITGSLGSDGTVFIQAMDEGGGGLNGPRTNYIFRSINGGVNWTVATQSAGSFLGPGRSASGYFPGMYLTPAGYWRHLGWGQPGVGPGGIVHYVYASRPATTGDPGNIFYIRSADNGLTWSTPLQMNTDASGKGQWQPSLTVNAHGKVMVTWFDERNDPTSPPSQPSSLERYGRASIDNGLTWGPEMPVSDVIFPKPLQVDTTFSPIYAGDRHDASFSDDNYGSMAYDTWTDGRVPISGSPQMDVFFDRNNLGIKAAFDFDGDGKTDIGIFRSAVTGGEWWVNRSSSGQTLALQFGASTDRIVPADYTGDGKADLAFWRPSTGQWFVLRSEDFSFFAVPFGTNGDTPTPADFDGDSKADFAVFRSSNGTWFISQSTGGQPRIFQFGINGDVPVVGDYDGDGKSDAAIFRPGPREWWINRSTAGVLAMQFGGTGDKAVQGDYTGDGRTDVAIWRPSNGNWLIVRSEDFSFFGFPFGASTDIPAPGDYDGDAKFDPAVFRPSQATWFIGRSSAGTQIVQFGANGDKPLPNAFVP